MARELSAELTAIVSAKKPKEDKLETLREAVRSYRILIHSLSEQEERVKEIRKRINEMQFKTLPDLFHEANVDKVGLPKEGNYPAYDAVMKQYCHANIPKDNQQEAFKWLEEHGHGDLIKTTIKVGLGLGERGTAKELEKMLDKLGLEYSRDLGVPWKTLTSWVREQLSKNETPPLQLLGAFVGTIVDLKERSDG